MLMDTNVIVTTFKKARIVIVLQRKKKFVQTTGGEGQSVAHVTAMSLKDSTNLAQLTRGSVLAKPITLSATANVSLVIATITDHCRPSVIRRLEPANAGPESAVRSVTSVHTASQN